MRRLGAHKHINSGSPGQLNLSQGKVKKCMSLKESPTDNKASLSPVPFPHFSLRAKRLIYYMQISFSKSISISIPSFVFYLFASWNSLLQLTGFLIFLLCLCSRSQMHSNEVTKSAKSGPEKYNLHYR